MAKIILLASATEHAIRGLCFVHTPIWSLAIRQSSEQLMGRGSRQGARRNLDLLEHRTSKAKGCLRMIVIDSLANSQGDIVWIELCQQPGVEGSLSCLHHLRSRRTLTTGLRSDALLSHDVEQEVLELLNCCHLGMIKMMLCRAGTSSHSFLQRCLLPTPASSPQLRG